MTLYGGGYEQGENSARGALTVTARVSNGSSRHAMPTLPELVYAALLYKDGASPASPQNKDFAQAETADGGKLNFSFQRPSDTSGTFTLEIFAFVKTDVMAEDGTTNFSKETALLSGGEGGLAIVGDAIVVTDPIALSSDKQGTVNLKIKVPDGCTLEFKELKIDGTTENDPHFAITGTSPNFVLAQKDENGISAGAYPVTFTVEKVNGEKKEIIHIFSEYINVINGLRTDTWWNGAKSSTTKEISQSMISSTVYVRGTGEGGGWYETSPYKDTATASDDNSGSFLSPLATIQKAVDTIIARNDGTSVYTIYVDGTFTATSSAALANFNALSQTQKLSVKIAGLDASQKAVLDGGGLASGIVVGKPAIYASATQKNMNLALENLVIQNAISTNAGYGGAIMLCCKADNSHTIKKCEIKNNNAAYGSAIYNEYAALDLQECLISENTTTNNGTVYITRAGATLKTSSDVRIENNTSRYYAGGVSVGKDSEFRMNGGAIIGNKATLSGFGGGVYVAEGGTFTMSGGTISGNSATMQGGGVYISANSSGMGTFNMSGEASIPAGDDGKNDVYLKASGSNTPIITVAGDLTAAIIPVATITLPASSYAAGTPVLSKLASVTATMQDICDKFALTPDPAGADWKIVPDGANGVLKTTTVYVRGTGATAFPSAAANGSDTNSGTLMSPFATIQKAVDTVLDMNDGADDYTIFVDGTLDGASGMADFSALSKNLNLTIKSLSENAKATLDANTLSRVIYANPAGGALNLTLEKLVITGGNATGSGGGIYYQSTGGILTVKGCTISGNTAGASGGGFYIDGGTVKMKDCTITDCKAGGTSNGEGGGGIYNASGTLELTGVTITLDSDGTRAAYRGGGIFNAGTLTMTGGSITGGGRLSINVYYGGGIYNTGVLTMEGVTISNFYAVDNGGGIYNNNGETAADFVAIKDCIITDCGSGQAGSGICTYKGKLKLENVDIIGGTADTSTGIYCYVSKLTIIGGKIEGFKDAAIHTSGNSELKMDGTTVSGNTSTDSCGGVKVRCPFEIKNCTITGNETKNWTNDRDGGGLYISRCTGTITNTTITGNTACGNGGGIYIYDTADVTITDCIIKDNTATTGGGGGIYIKASTVTLKMEGGEISGNTAGGNGGGVYNNGGTFTQGGTVSGNSPDDVYPAP